MSLPVAKYAVRREKDGRKKFGCHTNMCRDVAVLRLFPSISEATVSERLGILIMNTLEIQQANSYMQIDRAQKNQTMCINRGSKTQPWW